MKNTIPETPFDNPVVAEGTYRATTVKFSVRDWYDNRDRAVTVVCRLLDLDLYFVFCLKLPRRTIPRSSEPRSGESIARAMVKQDMQDLPRILKEKRYRVKIVRIQRQGENDGQPCYAVERFLDAEPDEEETNEP
jgi:hypothetical protein